MGEWKASAAAGLGALAISLVIGCSARRQAPLLVFGTRDADTPTIEQVPLALWMVDDAGWAYLVATYEGAQRPTIVAVSPEGSIAWSLPGAPPKGGMMAAGDDLCFVTEAGKEPSAVPPELVCIGPRHGWK